MLHIRGYNQGMNKNTETRNYFIAIYDNAWDSDFEIYENVTEALAAAQEMSENNAIMVDCHEADYAFVGVLMQKLSVDDVESDDWCWWDHNAAAEPIHVIFSHNHEWDS